HCSSPCRWESRVLRPAVAGRLRAPEDTGQRTQHPLPRERPCCARRRTVSTRNALNELRAPQERSHRGGSLHAARPAGDDIRHGRKRKKGRDRITTHHLLGIIALLTTG